MRTRCAWCAITAAWLASALPALAQAQEDLVDGGPVLRMTGSLEAWAYANRYGLTGDSVLNPGNQLAMLPRNQAQLDVRLNLRAERGPLEAILSQRWLEQDSTVVQAGSAPSGQTIGSGQLEQGLLRYKTGPDALTVGRELFTWGPANFRSPSNPFYFDAGRTNPLAATPGVDLVRYTMGLGDWRATGAYVASTSQITPAEDLGRSLLLKIDHQGQEHLASLVWSQQQGQSAPFVGGFAQWTPDDAWLVYGEFGSSHLAQALHPLPVGSGSLYSLQQPAPRSLDVLLGASYTLESGQVLTAETLHNDNGYGRAEEAAYFGQAVQAAMLAQQGAPALGFGALGQALGQAPRLLGRNYLWLGWQSNPQDSKLYWRTEWVGNLTDGSSQAMVYAERSFWPRLSGFAMLARQVGGAQTEYGALWRNTLILGLKFFVF